MVDTDGVWISCPLINHLAVHCLGWGKDDFYLYSLSGDGKCEVLAGIIWREAFGFFKLLGSMRRWWYSMLCTPSLVSVCVFIIHTVVGIWMTASEHFHEFLYSVEVKRLPRGENSSFPWQSKTELKWMQVCLYVCIVCVFKPTFSEKVNQAFCDWLNVYT